MAYVKTNWLDRLVQDPNKFSMVDNGDGTVTITEMPGNVYVEGTPVSAANLNKIENELVVLEQAIANSGTKFATTEEARAGTITNKAMSPKTTRDTLVARTASTSANLDAMFEAGIYFLPSTTNVTGKPTDMGSNANGSFLRVEASESTFSHHQEIVQLLTNKVWIRSRASSNPNTLWTDWKSKDYNIATTAAAQAGIDNESLMTPLRTYESTIFTAAPSTNLDELTRGGRFFYASNALPTNAPTDLLNQNTFVEVFSRRIAGGDMPAQMLFQVNGNIYMRGKISATSNLWSQWKRLDQVIATQAEAQEGVENTKTMTPLRTAQAIQKNALTKITIPRNSTSTTRYQKIAETNLANNTSEKLQLLISGIGSYGSNITGSAIVSMGARTNNGLDVNVLADSPFLLENTFSLIANASTGRLELWFLSGSYQAALEIYTLADHTGTAVVGLLDTQDTITGALPPRKFNRMGENVNLNTTNKKTLVDAINEVNAKSGNGFATLQEAQDGTATDKLMSPKRVFDAMKYKTLPTTVTDLNSVTEPGRYFISSASQAGSILNSPPGTNSNMAYLDVIVRSSEDATRPLQIFRQIGSGVSAFRGSGSSGFQPWVETSNRIATTSEATAGVDDTKVMTPLKISEVIKATSWTRSELVPNTVDFNTLVEPGMYSVGQGTLPFSPNFPPTANGYGNLVVFRGKNSNVRLTQIYMDYTGDAMFYRSASGGNFRSWFKLTTSKDIGELAALTTSNKSNVVAAINEAFQFANNGKTGIGNVVGISPNQTFPQMVSHLQSQKDRLSANLNAKNVTASPTESLASLVDKVATIDANHRVIVAQLGTNPNLDAFTLNGGNTMNLAYVTVNSIDFKAKTIILTQDNGNGGVWTGVYQEGVFAGNYRLSNSSTSYTSELEYNLLTTGGNAYINEQGFKLPVPLLGVSVRAQIIE